MKIISQCRKTGEMGLYWVPFLMSKWRFVLKTILATILFGTVALCQMPDRPTFVSNFNRGNARASEFHWVAEGPAQTTLLMVVIKPITPGECKRTYGNDFEPNPRDPLQFKELKELGFTQSGVKCTTAEGKSYIYSVDLTPGHHPHFTPEPPPDASPRTDMNSSTQTSRRRLFASQEHMDKGFALQSKGDQKGQLLNIASLSVWIQLSPNRTTTLAMLLEAKVTMTER